MAPPLLITMPNRTEQVDKAGRSENQIHLLTEDVMSVQKKSLISQRSAVKSAILATPQTSGNRPAVRPATLPARAPARCPRERLRRCPQRHRRKWPQKRQRKCPRTSQPKPRRVVGASKQEHPRGQPLAGRHGPWELLVTSQVVGGCAVKRAAKYRSPFVYPPVLPTLAGDCPPLHHMRRPTRSRAKRQTNPAALRRPTRILASPLIPSLKSPRFCSSTFPT